MQKYSKLFRYCASVDKGGDKLSVEPYARPPLVSCHTQALRQVIQVHSPVSLTGRFRTAEKPLGNGVGLCADIHERPFNVRESVKNRLRCPA
jgi:hypothetical protein